MSCAATYASAIPQRVQDKIAQYGHAIVAEWVPQQALLDHPVLNPLTYASWVGLTHWLGNWLVPLARRPQQHHRVDHGGRSRVRTSNPAPLCARLTFGFSIVWPITADQPANAIYLSEELDIAYELIEVRNGTGLGKILRNGRVPVGTIEAVKAEMHDVLNRALGEDGARKRAKLQSLRKTLQASWNEDGVARREVEEFLDDL